MLRHWCGCGYGWRAQRGFAAYPSVCLALIRGRVTCAACAVVGSWLLVTGIRVFVVPDGRGGISISAPAEAARHSGTTTRTRRDKEMLFFGRVKRQNRLVDVYRTRGILYVPDETKS